MEVTQVLELEDKIDHLGEADDARDEPNDHAHEEDGGTRILVMRRVEHLAEAAWDVGQVVQVGDDAAGREHVAHGVAEVEGHSGDVVQEHLLKVIHSLAEKSVCHEVLQVVAEGIEGVRDEGCRVSHVDRRHVDVLVATVCEPAQVPG